MTNNIRTELKTLAKPIGDFRTHERNVRQGDIGAICTSLEAHGQYRPIVVHKETNRILAGNHTFLAAQSLGWDKIAVTFVDCDEEQALRILIADNRSNDLALYDDYALSEVLKELALSQEGLSGTLYDGDDLDNLLRVLESLSANPVNPYEEWQGMSEFRNEHIASVFHTTVHFPTDEDVEKFFALLRTAGCELPLGQKRSSFWFPASDGHIGTTVKQHFVTETE
jgi:hypothetical protein